MNLLKLININLTYSNYALISLYACIHKTLTSGEIIFDTASNIYCLVYSKKGSATYKNKNKTATLPTGSLLFMSCKHGFQFRATNSGWEACFLFINGNVLSYYEDTIEFSAIEPHALSVDSPLYSSIHCLIQLNKSQSLAEELLVTEHVTQILSEYIHSDNLLSPITSKPPSYLIKIKEDFDLKYNTAFCLDSLASTYKVSKYRLCREFSSHFGLSPIKYLNKVRIQNACLLLVSENMYINEVSAAVGFENTNHFIRLFKAQMGMTPLHYKHSTHI